MVDIRPFAALRPPKELAPRVAAPPYDVLDSNEARKVVEDNPVSFLHVTKSEVDLPLETNLYSDVVYETAKSNLSKMISDGVLIRDAKPHFYVYQQRMGEHIQTGIVAGTSVAEYTNNVIKKHEKTRQGKEDDRTHHIMATNANTGPVFMTYRQRPSIDAIVSRIMQTEAELDFTADDGIGHTIWLVLSSEDHETIQSEFAQVDALYIADGHHRSASAARVAQLRRSANLDHEGTEPYNYFMSVIFPDNQLKILDYNRVVEDLNGLTPTQLLARLGEFFDVEQIPKSKPAKKGEFTMCLGGTWYRLEVHPEWVPIDHPVDSLDVSVLQDRVLAPILGIGDPRTDSRIDFIGGIRGMDELEHRVGRGVAFAVFPASMSELIAIADAGEIMPPKSTWFEPKLRSGLIVRTL